MKYFIPFYSMCFMLIEEIYCYHSYYNNNQYPFANNPTNTGLQMKRSAFAEASTFGPLSDPEDEAHLKEALELMNIGKKTLGLKTESPELLLQLVQDTNDKAKSRHIQQILQHIPETQKLGLGKQYLVLSGNDNNVRVENLTIVTTKPDTSVHKGNNVQDVFKMELEKKIPVGRENISHRITIVETNRMVPFSKQNLPFLTRRKRVHKDLPTWNRFGEPHGRHKRGRSEPVSFFFFDHFSENLRKVTDKNVRNVFRNGKDTFKREVLGSQVEIRGTKSTIHPVSLLSKKQKSLYLKHNDPPPENRSLGEEISQTPSEELQPRFQVAPNSSPKYSRFQPNYKVPFDFAKLLINNIRSLHRDTFFHNPIDENVSIKNIESENDENNSLRFFNSIPLITSLPPAFPTRNERKYTSKALLEEGLKFKSGNLMSFEDHAVERGSEQKESSQHLLPVVDKSRFQNKPNPNRYEEHLTESMQTNLLVVTSMMTVALLCFITGLLVYSKFGRHDQSTLQLKGKNVTVKVCDEDTGNWRKHLSAKQLFAPNIKPAGYKTLAIEEDGSGDLEWQSELGEWLSDFDEKGSI